jgi:predicted nucleic acid-binding protein
MKANSRLVYIPSVVLAELERGIRKLELADDRDKANELRSWVRAIRADFANRIQSVNADDAILAGQLRAQAEFRSARVSLVDSVVAAQARHRGWHVLTANIKDFRALGASILAISQSVRGDKRQLVLPFDETATYSSTPADGPHLP